MADNRSDVVAPVPGAMDNGASEMAEGPEKLIGRDNKLVRQIEWAYWTLELRLVEPGKVPHATAPGPQDWEKLDALLGKAASPGPAARTDALRRAVENGPRSEAAREYTLRYGVRGVRLFRASGGVHLYLMPVETFPNHVNNLYLIADGELRTLVDAGSGTPTSRDGIDDTFAVVRAAFDERAEFETLDQVIVTHAHIDHFGGVGDVRKMTGARIAVHELDARVLANFEERLVVAGKDLAVFLRRSGIDETTLESFREMYTLSKNFFRSVEPDRKLRDGDLVGNGYRVHHTPGHCPGEICLQVGDVLLTGDHVIARITPHQAPQSITPFTGLEHYFHSLAKVRKLEGIDLALGGHETPMPDLRARIDEIAIHHRERLHRIREICVEKPRTVLEIAEVLFPTQSGYGKILAIEEAGAHVEYLHALGELRIANLDEVAKSDAPVIRYRSRS